MTHFKNALIVNRCPSGVIMRAATSPEVHQLPLAPYLRPKTPFEKKTSTNSHSSYVRGVAGPYGKQQKNVVCYFSNWAVDREGDGKFVPENLDARCASCSCFWFERNHPGIISLQVVHARLLRLCQPRRRDPGDGCGLTQERHS